MSTIETVDVVVRDDNPARDPIEGVVVRVFDSTGTYFVTSAVTDADGKASMSLVAPITYQLRFFKDRVSIRQPQAMPVLMQPIAPDSNIFDISGHVFTPPEAVHPRLCRASGFFKRPNGSVAIGHDIHIIAKFDPILFEGAAMLTERILARTDDNGYVEFDLVRFGQYEVTVEGFEDTLRIITVPDRPSVNLPDLLFAVVSSIEFDPPGPWSVSIGPLNYLELTPIVHTSDGRVLPGTALQDVAWSTSDSTVAVVEVTPKTLQLRGIAPGAIELRAVRRDCSIVRIPNTPLEGVPVAVTVS